MTWFIYCLLSIATLALAELMQQHLLNSDRKFDERASAVLTFLIQAILSIPFIFFFGLQNSLMEIFNRTTFPYLILVSLLSSVGMIFYLKSFRVKNISISTIFISLSIMVSTTLGVIVLHETLYPIKLLGIFLILAAIVSLNINNLQLEKNHFFGLVAGLFFGLSYTLDKILVIATHPFIYMIWAFSMISFFGFLFGPKQVITSLAKAKPSDYKPLLISGLAYFLFNFFTFTAYTVGGEVGRVDAINNSQVFLIILVEYFILRHRQGFLRKILTSVVAFAGVMILGML